MSTFYSSKSCLKGSMVIPSSKSQTLRAILFAALAKGKSQIRSPLLSEDAKAMIKAVKTMGAVVEEGKDLFIEGTGGKIGPFKDIVDVGNSGISLRFLTAVFALSPYPSVITGDHSIRHQRPMSKLIKALNYLGGHIESLKGDGFAPLLINGPLEGNKTKVSGEDSQPVSALLIAAALKSSPTTITVENPGELPWIGVTLDWFDRLGIPYENEDFVTYRMKGGSLIKAFDYTVSGDFSSAAFPLAAAIITDSSLTLENLDILDPQGDKALIDVVKSMGAKVEYVDDLKSLKVLKGGRLKGIEVDVNTFIDAVPILATLACYAEGTTIIKGAKVAKEKECDRLNASAQELQKMGADIKMTDDGLIIRGKPLKGAKVFSHHDHRMAMSLSVAGMGAAGMTEVTSVDCVAKTFPTFLKSFQSIGATIRD